MPKLNLMLRGESAYTLILLTLRQIRCVMRDPRPCPRLRFSGDDLPVAFAGPWSRFQPGSGIIRRAGGPLPDVPFSGVRC